MSAQDPFAQYGGHAVGTDPFAQYGGKSMDAATAASTASTMAKPTPTPPVTSQDVVHDMGAGAMFHHLLSEFELNAMEPFAARDANGFKIPDAVKGLLSLPPKLATNPTGVVNDLASGVAQGPAELYQGYKNSDPSLGAAGAAHTITNTLPAIFGAAEGIESLNAARRGAGLPVTPTITETSALARKMGISTQEATQVQPLAKQAMDEFGFNELSKPGTPMGVLPIRVTTPAADVIGNTVRGGTQAQWDSMAGQIAKERGIPTKMVGPIQLELGRRIVDIADRPFNAAMQAFGKESSSGIKEPIAQSLEAQAASYDGPLTQKLADTLRGYADHVRSTETLEEINQIKKDANNLTTLGIDKKVPGAQIQLDATTAGATQKLADTIREGLYPRLAELGGPDMTEYGDRMHTAIKARDGLFKTYEQAASEETEWRDKTWAERFKAGAFPTSSGTLNNPRAFIATFGKKILGSLANGPMGEYNRLLSRGIGDVGENFQSESVDVSPSTTLGGRNLLPPNAGPFQFTIKGDPTIQTMSQMRLVDADRIYNGTREVPNPNYTGPVQNPNPASINPADARLPSHYQLKPPPAGSAQARVNAVGPVSAAVPDTSFTGKPTLTQSDWQYMSGASTDPLRKPSGPGTLTTNDPAIVENTVRSINDRLNQNPPPVLKQHLLEIQGDLTRQLQQYYSMQKPIQKVTITPMKPGIKR